MKISVPAPVNPSSGHAGTHTSTDQKADTSRIFNMERLRQTLGERYLEWTDLAEEERIRHTYLKKHALSETDLDNLSPADKAAHEEKIAELTKQPLLSLTARRNAASQSLSKPVMSLQSLLEVSDHMRSEQQKP